MLGQLVYIREWMGIIVLHVVVKLGTFINHIGNHDDKLFSRLGGDCNLTFANHAIKLRLKSLVRLDVCVKLLCVLFMVLDIASEVVNKFSLVNNWTPLL